MKLFNITKGFWFMLFTPSRVKIMAAKRMEICNACDWKQGPQCGLCGCVLKAKTKVAEEECPSMKWGKEPERKSVK